MLRSFVGHGRPGQVGSALQAGAGAYGFNPQWDRAFHATPNPYADYVDQPPYAPPMHHQQHQQHHPQHHQHYVPPHHQQHHPQHYGHQAPPHLQHGLHTGPDLSHLSQVPQPAHAASHSNHAKVEKAPKKPAKPAKPMKEPKKGKVTAANLFITQFAKEKQAAGETFVLADAWRAYRGLTEDDKAKLLAQLPNVLADRKQAYDEFVSTLTPRQIREENALRRKLRREQKEAGTLNKNSMANLREIKDPRAPKKPQSAYIKFFMESRETPEFRGLPVTELAKAVSAKWKTLTEQDKTKYMEEAKVDYEKYKREMERYMASST
ncbi:hypothetical protein PYCC9005_004637 [Savitreella phatthalungensis]